MSKLRIAVAVVSAALVLGGCTIGLDEDVAPGAPTALDDAASAPNPTLPGANPSAEGVPGTSAEASLPGELVAAVKKVEQDFGGQAGLALATPGSEPKVASTGSFQAGPAWSTSKVPIAIAVVRQSGVSDQVRAAITHSDNAAAEAMWSSLGDSATASATATGILREGGDSVTNVESQRLRPEYSIFGQTNWALANQATFGANLQCLQAGSQVAELMGQIVADQSYGLGQISGAHFKGGWGPNEAGSYLVRQFGYIPGETPGTFVGVAIAAQPADGTYATGQKMLNSLAAAISAASTVVSERAGSC